jgi:hypothetical protein
MSEKCLAAVGDYIYRNLLTDFDTFEVFVILNNEAQFIG